jgi:hypothetical protein
MSTHAYAMDDAEQSSSHARYVRTLVIARTPPLATGRGFCLGVLSAGPEITCGMAALSIRA